MTDKISSRIIRTPEDATRAGADLVLIPAKLFPLEVTVTHYKVKLTDPQRDRLFWLHELRAQALNAYWPERAAAIIAGMDERGVPLSKLERTALLSKVWTKDDMHAEWKGRYGVKSANRIRGPRKLDMTDKISEYEADLIGQGVEIPAEPEWREAA